MVTFDVLLPEDLAVAPEDPHPLLEGADAQWPWRSMSVVTPRLYYSRLFRTQANDDAETTALELGRKIAEGGYAGLIMDCRGARVDHDAAAFKSVADAFAASFPRGLLVVYLHDAATASFTAFMRALLRERGVKTARMTDFNRAWAAILDQLNNPAA